MGLRLDIGSSRAFAAAIQHLCDTLRVYSRPSYLPYFLLLGLHQAQSDPCPIDISNHISFVKVRPRDHHRSSSSTLSMKTAAISDPGNFSGPYCRRVIGQGWVCEGKSWSSICWTRGCWLWMKWIPASWIRSERILEFLNVGGWKLVWLIDEVSPSNPLKVER